MNGRTSVLIANYTPEVAIIVYKGNQGEWYLESHTIDEQGRILEGKPLKQETLDGMVSVFFDEQRSRTDITGIMPSNMLSFSLLPGGYYQMLWYRPEEVRKLFFVNDLHIPNGEAVVPPMLYLVERHDLKVFALDNNDRPDVKSKIYRAPFHNVASDGDVCLGSAKVKKPEKNYVSLMKYWEDLFWLSEFSHLNGATNPTKSNLNMLWKRLIEKKSLLHWSEMGELVAIKNITLEDILP